MTPCPCDVEATAIHAYWRAFIAGGAWALVVVIGALVNLLRLRIFGRGDIRVSAGKLEELRGRE